MIAHTNSLFNSVSYRIDSVLVDLGDEWEGFYGVEAVLLTHGHFDHIYGLNRVVELNPQVRIFTNHEGANMIVNSRRNLSFYNDMPFVFEFPEKIVIIADGEAISIGDAIFTAIFTLGHNPSCITWLSDDFIFTGDSYITGIKVVTIFHKVINYKQKNQKKGFCI